MFKRMRPNVSPSPVGVLWFQARRFRRPLGGCEARLEAGEEERPFGRSRGGSAHLVGVCLAGAARRRPESGLPHTWRSFPLPPWGRTPPSFDVAGGRPFRRGRAELVLRDLRRA